ncbi:MAG: alpha/beta hydrolase [Acidimicrobiales bacterium]|nr:alpha/beta hydrolase [Acidimicrobiales bacterium]
MYPAAEHVQINDISMAYNRHGDGDRPLVLVHGITGARHDWRKVVGPLSEARSVITIDQRGHGETSHPADPSTYHFDQLVDDLAGFIEEVVGGSFDLLGHSMGGMVAMRYAMKKPDRLRSLVLMNTAPVSPEKPFGLDPEHIEGLFAAVAEHGLAVAREMNAAVPNPERELVDELHGPEFFAADEDWRYERIDPMAIARLGPVTFRHPSVLDRLADIDLPVTVVCGDLDTAFWGPSRQMVDVLPNAEFVGFEGAYHSPQHTHTEDWLAAVEEHLARSKT